MSSSVSTETGASNGLPRRPLNTVVSSSVDGLHPATGSTTTPRARFGCSPAITASALRNRSARNATGASPSSNAARPSSAAAAVKVRPGASSRKGAATVNLLLSGTSADGRTITRSVPTCRSRDRLALSTGSASAVRGSTRVPSVVFNASAPAAYSGATSVPRPAASSEGVSSGTNGAVSVWSTVVELRNAARPDASSGWVRVSEAHDSTVSGPGASVIGMPADWGSAPAIDPIRPSGAS